MRTTTRFFSFFFLLVASAAYTQPLDYSTGGNLKRRQYQTYAAMTLYVDPTGSDSNACTASGTAACLTIQGAFNKLPRFIQFNVAMNLAAGTFAGFNAVGLQFGRMGVSTQPTFTMTGAAYIAVIPATGIGAGTSTSFTNAAATSTTITEGVLTDAAQTWTVNDLRGRFLVPTSGVANGIKVPIIANTATTITFGAALTGFVNGDAYAIQTPSTVVNSAVVVKSIEGDSTFNITNVDFTSTFLANRAMPPAANATGVLLLRSSIIRGLLTLNNSYFSGSTTSGAASEFLGGVSIFSGRFGCGCGFVRAATNGILLGAIGPATVGGGSALGPCTIDAGTASGLSMDVATTQLAASSYFWIRGSGTTNGIVGGFKSGSLWVFRVDNTTNGVTLSQSPASSPSTATVICNTVTNCVVLAVAASMKLSTLTVSGVTSDVTVDGTAYTKAAIQGFTPQSVLGNQGSLFSF